MNTRTVLLGLCSLALVAAGCSDDASSADNGTADASVADGSSSGDATVDGAPDGTSAGDGSSGGDGTVGDAAAWDAPVDAGPVITQWVPFELPTFTAKDDHKWSEFPLQVTFEHEGGTKLVLDGYWAGGKSWKVRFAAPLAGAWTWTASSKTGDKGLEGHGGYYAAAPSAADIKSNPNLHGHVHVKGRYFAYADDTPFLPLGDTFWRMNSLLPLGKLSGDFDTYLDDRTSKGFNSVLIMYVSSAPNEGGYLWDATTKPPNDPTVDWSKINPTYFDSLDTRINAFWDRGLVIFGHPTWLVEISKINLTQAVDISHYLLARYSAYNLVWSLTGEFHLACEKDGNKTFCEHNYKNIGELGRWLGGSTTPPHPGFNPFKHPMSVHPGGYNTGAPIDDLETSRIFDKEPWLDHHWIQTYAETDKVVYRIAELRGEIPGGLSSHRPALMAEPSYEYHLNGRFTDWDQGSGATKQAAKARRQAWTSMFVGAAGHIYGANGIWQAEKPSALKYTGSGQVHWVKDVLLGLGWPKLTPNKCVEVERGGTWKAPSLDYPSNASDHGAVLRYTYAPRCLMNDKHTYAVYIPSGNESTSIRLAMLGGEEYKARWFNPRDGTYRTINGGKPINTTHKEHYTVPARPATSNRDWVLILER